MRASVLSAPTVITCGAGGARPGARRSRSARSYASLCLPARCPLKRSIAFHLCIPHDVPPYRLGRRGYLSPQRAHSYGTWGMGCRSMPSKRAASLLGNAHTRSPISRSSHWWTHSARTRASLTSTSRSLVSSGHLQVNQAHATSIPARFLLSLSHDSGVCVCPRSLMPAPTARHCHHTHTLP